MLVNIKKNPLLFGCDPEAAAVYKKDGKTYTLPPFFFRKFLGVETTDPAGDGKHPLFFQEKEYKMIEDGANFEFTVQPSFHPKDLFDRVQKCAADASERILKLFPNYCEPFLAFLPTTDWDVERWTKMLEEHDEDFAESFNMSTRFGCDPDMDVFNFNALSQIQDVKNHPERYCGGHIHVSGSEKISEDTDLAVKCMCITAGVAATAFSEVPALEHRRLYYYGRPGRYRVQNYGKDNPFGAAYARGIEYRTVSTHWAGNWGVAEKVLRWAEIGIRDLLETSLGTDLVKQLVEPSIDAIMHTDQETAKQLLQYIETKI